MDAYEKLEKIGEGVSGGEGKVPNRVRGSCEDAFRQLLLPC